jgi:urease accessory protein UreF
MLSQTQPSARAGAELLGELHPFIAQLGSADGLVTLGTVATFLQLPPIENVTALAQFLEAYRARILLAVELPAIGLAWQHGSRNEVRELIAVDQALAQNPALQPFAAASRRVGRSQLEKLRPLRDQRVVQRYLRAVEGGQAHAWHTLVFGLTLALYSLPLRQGLATYARQTIGGFIRAAARPLRLTRAECQELLERMCANLPRELEAIVGGCEPSGNAKG